MTSVKQRILAFTAVIAIGAASRVPKIIKTDSKVDFETAKAVCGNNLVEFHDPLVKPILAAWLDGKAEYIIMRIRQMYCQR